MPGCVVFIQLITAISAIRERVITSQNISIKCQRLALSTKYPHTRSLSLILIQRRKHVALAVYAIPDTITNVLSDDNTIDGLYESINWE